MAQNAERSTGDAASAPKKVLCLSASARPDGNARQMAEALLEGVAQALGFEGVVLHLEDHAIVAAGRERDAGADLCGSERGDRGFARFKLLDDAIQSGNLSHAYTFFELFRVRGSF